MGMLRAPSLRRCHASGLRHRRKHPARVPAGRLPLTLTRIERYTVDTATVAATWPRSGEDWRPAGRRRTLELEIAQQSDAQMKR
jgi:hypothetical protein